MCSSLSENSCGRAPINI
uniref:Uncharacterized protein n=1 Tax=Arundo donax TaxID=35708 RepID=A0A0A8Z7T2_ARUDO